MGRRQLSGRSGGSAEYHGNIELSARHLPHFRSVVYDLINPYQRKIKGHEFYDRPVAVHGRSHANAGKSQLRNGSIQNPVRSEFIQHAFGSLVRTVVLCHFLTH